MPSPLRLSRVQRKGQVTIPREMRLRFGIEEGDFVAFVETDEGILIAPQKVVPSDAPTKMAAVVEQLRKRAPRPKKQQDEQA
jgi:AbrB family looped-hinge helix DNA binding protein